MTWKGRRRVGFAIAVSLALAALAPAHGQDAATETTVVGSWLVSCVDPGLPSARCEMVQRVIDGSGETQILAASVIASRDAAPAEITFTTPLGVWLEPGVLLASPSGFSRPLEYERCAQDGCVVRTTLDEELLAAFAAGGLAEFRFADRLKQLLSAPVALDGFSDGVAKLEDETTPRSSNLLHWLRRFHR